MKKIQIKNIIKESIAEELNIKPGDYLISINNQEIKDILDYKFQIFDENIIVVIEKASGEEWELDIEKDENEDLGLVFEEQLIDKPKRCANKCIFCFMDQLPNKVRKTLVFKDDDFRLSFITGNYVTLTNTSYKDLDRIIKYHLSPINISVHATLEKVREIMLNNKNAGKILEQIEYLTKNGININAQIVLCRDINDDKILDKTIEDLSKFYPNLQCIAIVPVGLTKYRTGLYNLKPFDKESAKNVIKQINKWQKIFKKKYNYNLVYLADEFYVQSEISIPKYESYDDFHQLENGIGMIAYFEKEFNNYLESIDNFSKLNTNNKSLHDVNFKTVSIATGKSAYKYIREKANILEKKFKDIKINVYQIENTYFGSNITVTGLLVGSDLLKQLKGKELGEYLVLVSYMFKDNENIFLDDMKLEYLEKELGTKIKVINNNGEEFVKGLIF